MIESQFSYGKGYVYGCQSSNFAMSDASNLASIDILKLIPEDSFFPHKGCFCIDCASVLHEREAKFDAIKTAIERCMVVAFEEGRKYQAESRKEKRETETGISQGINGV